MTSFSTFLQEQYIKVHEFYTNLQGKFAGEHPELFPEYNFSHKMSYSAEELKKAFNIILNLNSEKLSLPEIEHLLGRTSILQMWILNAIRSIRVPMTLS
ncbi:hypothetical protein [Rickettsia endosymbiont of Cantharis rufa]|uniref:hypothetical protein n=1 Tax=Rickettsia endosymbiont of Cantharis rufa TaxID=3066248 RepID=UPI003132D330